MKLIIPLFFLFFYTQAILANTCVNAFSRLSTFKTFKTLKTPKTVQRIQQSFTRFPQEVQNVLKISGLQPEEIEKLNILYAVDTQHFPAETNHRTIVNYLRNVFGAKSAFSLTDNRLDHRTLSERTLTQKEVNEIKAHLEENLSDITLAVVREFEDKSSTTTRAKDNNPSSMKQWLENLTRVTEPGGLIIINVSKYGNNNYISSQVFESILSQMQTIGAIETYTQYRTNRHSKTLSQLEPTHGTLLLMGATSVMAAMGVVFTPLGIIQDNPTAVIVGGLFAASASLPLIFLSTYPSDSSVTYKIINGSSQHLKDQIDEAY